METWKSLAATREEEGGIMVERRGRDLSKNMYE